MDFFQQLVKIGYPTPKVNNSFLVLLNLHPMKN